MRKRSHSSPEILTIPRKRHSEPVDVLLELLRDHLERPVLVRDLKYARVLTAREHLLEYPLRVMIDPSAFLATLLGLARDVRLNFDAPDAASDSGKDASAGLREIFDLLCKRPEGATFSRARYVDSHFGGLARREWLAGTADKLNKLEAEAKVRSEAGEPARSDDLWAKELLSEISASEAGELKKTGAHLGPPISSTEARAKAIELVVLGRAVREKHGATRRKRSESLGISARAHRKKHAPSYDG